MVELGSVATASDGGRRWNAAWGMHGYGDFYSWFDSMNNWFD
jgi:hypothetical protein